MTICSVHSRLTRGEASLCRFLLTRLAKEDWLLCLRDVRYLHFLHIRVAD